MIPNAKLQRCATCGAIFEPDDRFCATCGATREEVKAEAKKGRRGTWLTISVSVALLAALSIGLLLYFTAPERRSDSPVGHVTLNGRPVVAIDPGPPVITLMGSGDGMSVSSDRGGTWQTMPGGGAIGAIATAPAGQKVIYLAGQQLLKFNGGGLTTVQTSLPTPNVVAMAVAPDSADHVFAIVKGQGLSASADGGKSWQALKGSIPTDSNSLALSSTAMARFFIGTDGHGVYASVDGQNWTNASGFVNGALPTPNVRAVAFDPRSGDQYVGPSGQSTSGALYAATDIGVFKSIDSGLSWSSLPFHHNTVALAVATDGSHLMLAIDSDGNVYRSQDGGNSWGS